MDLSSAIDAYLADQRGKGTRESTLKGVRRILQLLLADVGNIKTQQLRPQHLDTFWMNRTTWGPGTMNRARSALGNFFKWCQARGYMKRDIDLMNGYRRLKVPPRDRVNIPQSAFEDFLDGIEDPRARIVAALGLYLFTRISETQALRIQDLDLDRGTVEVYRPKTTTVDTLPICSELDSELRRWLLHYAAKVGETPRPEWFLIPAIRSPRRFGTKGTKGFVYSEEIVYFPGKQSVLGHTMKELLEEAGYYKPMEGGHTLRRSGARALYDQLSSVGHDRAIRVCQAMLGHTSIQTTEVYLRLDLDRKVRNDLLAGKPMFPHKQVAEVVRLEEVVRGQAGGRDVSV